MKKRTFKLAALLLCGSICMEGAGLTAFASSAETQTEMETELKTASEAEAETETETETEPQEIFWSEDKTLYMTDDVYVREAADTGAEAVSVAHRGEGIVVIGEVGDWYIVNLAAAPENPEEEETEMSAEDLAEAEMTTEISEEAEAEVTEEITGGAEAAAENSVEMEIGYVVKKYITENKEEADQAVAAQEYAVKAAQEEAARQAAAAAAAASHKSSGKYEVSRQKYPDCDGSGHGYYEIKYSDGSTATVDY